MTVPAYPIILADGTVADANQVMTNFYFISDYIGNNLALSGANSDITSLSALTTPLSIIQGGTGNTTGAPSGPAGGILTGTYPNPTFANAGNLTVLANITGGSAPPTATGIAPFSAALTPFGGDTGTGGTVGAVPAPPAGSAANQALLGANGSWVTPTLNLPSGCIIMFGGTTAPAGWYIADGSAKSTTTDASLFAAIGYTFGGSGPNFNLPNMGGQFPRGYVAGQTVDAGRVFGSTQTDAMQGHFHAFPPGSLAFFAQVSSSSESTEAGTNATFDNKFASTGSPVSDTVNGTPRVAAETRPTNVALTFIIKR